MEYKTLNNGVVMPRLGYGVYLISQEECERCVLDAISVGYRAIDTAQAYGNEEGVGAAISKCGISRGELFITSKIWINNSGVKKAEESINLSLKKLKTDYIDLMLVHQPFGDYYGTYRAMEKAVKQGKIRAIGISNFYGDRLADICLNFETTPAVNQVETHPLHMKKELHAVMDKYGVTHESWAPLGQARNGLLTNPVICGVAEKHGKTAAQVALKYLLQNDIVVIPKSVHKERMAENFNVFDFTLDADDLAAIAELDDKKNTFFSHHTAFTAERLINLYK